MRINTYLSTLLLLSTGSGIAQDAAATTDLNSTSGVTTRNKSQRPNLIMIMTDEHNFRTLGCYRDLMERKQAHPWGEGIKVNTPNLDKLAQGGAIYKNFYTVAPLCTPSRASFMSGKYPPGTGASNINHGKMDEDIQTFADILKEKKGYYTGYFGKWHLDGEPKPGWNTEKERKFGFIENKFRFNRGHWKLFEKKNRKVEAYTFSAKDKFKEDDSVKEHYSTDFLFDRGIEFIDRQIRDDKHFAMVLSITDPHAPNMVRPPYDTMFQHFNFTLPQTARAAARGEPAAPLWNRGGAVMEGEADERLAELEAGIFWQNHMAWYFGMVKCLDENVGKLLHFLSEKGIDEDTIIVFTSDHGDQLMEHGKLNKGTPYETSAGIPFIVRYPKKVKAGKIIESTYSSVDFAPTILGLMGVYNVTGFDGIDGSMELLDDNPSRSADENIRFSFGSGKHNAWAASITNGYKLVISRIDIPWLFNLTADPDEMHNYHDDPKYNEISAELKSALMNETLKFPDTFFAAPGPLRWDRQSCIDSRDAILGRYDQGFCSQLQPMHSSKVCEIEHIRKHCPVACNSCCEDSVGFLVIKRNLITCEELSGTNHCLLKRVKEFCPTSCNVC